MRHTYVAATLVGALAATTGRAQGARALVHYVDSLATAAFDASASSDGR
jgi:hypothetical protein